MRTTLSTALLSGLLCASGAGAADFGVYGTAGTIGYGGGLAANFGSYVGARVGYTTFDYQVEDLEESDLVFDGTAELGGVQALLDFYPFGGGFRLSAGVIETPAVDVSAVPVANTFTFDGVMYSSADVGVARGAARYGSNAPYVGLGFGKALSTDGRFALSLDAGVALTGAPDVALDVTCTAAAALLCAQLTDDVAAEQAQLQRDAEDYKYWPVLSLGVSYRF